MQSVFKLPLAAAALAEVDAGRLTLAERDPPHRRSTCRPPVSRSTRPGRRRRTATPSICRPSTSSPWRCSDSDNTAADVLMKRIGGPGRGDRLAAARRHRRICASTATSASCSRRSLGMASFRPAWKDQAASPPRATPCPARRARRRRPPISPTRATRPPPRGAGLPAPAGRRRADLAGLDARCCCA